MRADMVEQAWRIVQPVLDAWAAEKADFPNYASGSSGPEAADRLLAESGRGMAARHLAARAEEMTDSETTGTPKTLAIDIGGTGLKAAVLDATGKMVTSARACRRPTHVLRTYS